MKHWSSRFVAVAAWLAVTSAGAQQPLPVNAFFADPQIGHVSLSPDGTAVAMASPSPSGRLHLVVVELRSMTPRALGGFNDAHVGHVQWLNDQEIAYRAAPLSYIGAPLSAPGERGYGLYVARRDGGAPPKTVIAWDERGDSEQVDRVNLRGVSLLLDTGPRSGRWQYLLEPDPAVRQRRTLDWRLARLDTESLNVERLDAPRSIRQALIDPAGRPRAAVQSKGLRSTLHLRGREGWREVLSFPRYEGREVTPVHAASDGRVYVTAPDARGYKALYTIDPDTGTLPDRPMLALDGFDVVPSFVANENRTLGLRLQADTWVTQWWDDSLKKLQAEVDGRLPGLSNHIEVPWRGDAPFVLVRSESDQQPARWFVYHRGERRLVLLGSTHPQFSPADVARMAQTDFVRVPSRDGLSIPVYVTRPAGAKPGQTLPVVVWVRSEAQSREADWAWRAEWQFLASRGYLVLAPELRGASGFGVRHWTAGLRQWGRASQDDVVDVMRWAGQRGGDPGRACVIGQHWGGYVALMAALRDAAAVRCAVAYQPVVDPRGLYDEERWRYDDEWFDQWLPRLVGDPAAEALDEVSPLRQAEKLNVPTLIGLGQSSRMHQRVLAERLVSRLTGRLSGFERALYTEDDGTLFQLRDRVDFWRRTEAFLARHTAPR